MTPEAFNAEKIAILEPSGNAFKKAFEVDPAMVPAWDAYVNTEWYLGRTDSLQAEALSRLEAGDNFKDLYTVGKIAFMRGVDEDSRHASAGLGPDSPAAVPYFARTHEFFERAEKVAPLEKKLLLFNHGYALEKVGQPDQAIEKYLLSIREDAIFAEAHYNVGVLYMEKKQDTVAIEHLSEVLRWGDPTHRFANINLARIHARNGDKATARKHLETILKVSPRDQIILNVWQELGL